MKILIVDDVTQMRIKTKMMLSSLGYDETDESPNGVQALEELDKSGPYDVLLLDWNMPGLSGIETLKQIRANPNHSKTKIVMVTSKGTKEDVLGAVGAGADSYIIKPVSNTSLEKCLNSL